MDIDLRLAIDPLTKPDLKKIWQAPNQSGTEFCVGLFSFSDILKKLQAQNPNLKKRLNEASAVQNWERAVGPLIAKHAQATRVDAGVLFVEVDHSIWKTELHHRKHQILEKLNEGQTEIIQDIFLIDPKRPYR